MECKIKIPLIEFREKVLRLIGDDGDVVTDYNSKKSEKMLFLRVNLGSDDNIMKLYTKTFKNPKKLPRHDMVNSIVSVFLSKTPAKIRRKLEQRNIKKFGETEELFVSLMNEKYEIPKHLVTRILYFLEYDEKLMYSVGLVNSTLLITVLTSWKSVKISLGNLYDISSLVLQNVREIVFCFPGMKSLPLKKEDFQYLRLQLYKNRRIKRIKVTSSNLHVCRKIFSSLYFRKEDLKASTFTKENIFGEKSPTDKLSSYPSCLAHSKDLSIIFEQPFDMRKVKEQPSYLYERKLRDRQFTEFFKLTPNVTEVYHPPHFYSLVNLPNLRSLKLCLNHGHWIKYFLENKNFAHDNNIYLGNVKKLQVYFETGYMMKKEELMELTRYLYNNSSNNMDLYDVNIGGFSFSDDDDDDKDGASFLDLKNGSEQKERIKTFKFRAEKMSSQIVLPQPKIVDKLYICLDFSKNSYVRVVNQMVSNSSTVVRRVFLSNSKFMYLFDGDETKRMEDIVIMMKLFHRFDEVVIRYQNFMSIQYTKTNRNLSVFGDVSYQSKEYTLEDDKYYKLGLKSCFEFYSHIDKHMKDQIQTVSVSLYGCNANVSYPHLREPGHYIEYSFIENFFTKLEGFGLVKEYIFRELSEEERRMFLRDPTLVTIDPESQSTLLVDPEDRTFHWTYRSFVFQRRSCSVSTSKSGITDYYIPGSVIRERLEQEIDEIRKIKMEREEREAIETEKQSKKYEEERKVRLIEEEEERERKRIDLLAEEEENRRLESLMTPEELEEKRRLEKKEEERRRKEEEEEEEEWNNHWF